MMRLFLPVTAGLLSLGFLLSAPAANAFSEPVRTMAPISESASNASSANPSSATSASQSALRAFGRLRVMRPTRPFRETRMFSKAWSILLTGFARRGCS